MRRLPRLPFLLLAATCAASEAHAGDDPYFEELPQVLSASRMPQALNEAPGAVTVIDRELIAATGYRDLARLLRLVPGMQVGQERGHAQWVTYHGLSNDFPTEMQVLIDGRSVITPSAFGGVDWSALPLTLDEIDRIEVVRGTNAS
ncbi:MAG TPA: Plug domain-containing protein, partial [Aromatoleum sp.]|uniref:TonB-dependent receptor plug domain-containing protein n=1 Tax=Aromatoleum sp. TaxID=2307007 RepID=UPI002B472D7A